MIGKNKLLLIFNNRSFTHQLDWPSSRWKG